MQPKQHHSLIEDVIALVTGALFIALGIYLFQLCGFLTGGTAGLALVLASVSPFSFGQIFFVINLPFYYLAWTRMGKRFTMNTLMSVTFVSLVVDNFDVVLQVESVEPIFSAVFGGFLIGTGMLIMFRHVSSLGGVGILAKYIQDTTGFSAGKFQMAVDVVIVLVGFFLVTPWVLALSILGAAALNMVIAINHKPGRYQIT